MKKLISLNAQSPEIKARREKIERDVEAFLKAGGKKQIIPDGKSANVDFSFVIHTGDKE